MNLHIVARNFELTNDLREQVAYKLEQFAPFIDEEHRVHVIFEEKDLTCKIEILFHFDGMFIKEELRDKSPQRALNRAIKKLQSKLGKIENKRQDRYTQEFHSFLSSLKPSLEPQEVKPHITRRKSFNIKPMSEEEAVLQMELLSHEFFMFFNAETNGMCLLYKRKDGNYGFIESNQ